MCHVVIVDRYKYKCLRRDLLRICNEFPLLSYILRTQHNQHLLFISIIAITNKTLVSIIAVG